MRFRQGVAAEILISLALVMATGTALLAAVLLRIDDERIERLHGLLGRGFVASAHHGIVDFDQADAGHWWSLDARGAVRGINAPSADLDPRTRALARASIEAGEPLVESGAAKRIASQGAIRFAAPEPARELLPA